MTTLECMQLFTASELSAIFGIQVANPFNHILFCKWIYLADGGVMTHDNFASMVNYMNDNSYLDDPSRYATLMALQPATTAAPDIRST